MVIKPLPSNAKPLEIIGHIEHHFPQLAGALAQLLQDFKENHNGVKEAERLHDENQRLEEINQKLQLKLNEDIVELAEKMLIQRTTPCLCPNCGTRFNFEKTTLSNEDPDSCNITVTS